MKFDDLFKSSTTEFDSVSYQWAMNQYLSKFNSPKRDGEAFWEWLSGFPSETTVGYAHSGDLNPLSIYYMENEYKDLGQPVVWISTQCMVVFRVVSRLSPDDPFSDDLGFPSEISEHTGTILPRWAEWFMKRLVYSNISEPASPISSELALDVLRDVYEYYGDLAGDDI